MRKKKKKLTMKSDLELLREFGFSSRQLNLYESSDSLIRGFEPYKTTLDIGRLLEILRVLQGVSCVDYPGAYEELHLQASKLAVSIHERWHYYYEY